MEIIKGDRYSLSTEVQMFQMSSFIFATDSSKSSWLAPIGAIVFILVYIIDPAGHFFRFGVFAHMTFLCVMNVM